jgi:Dehydrogenases with different specificities (related to short-chain alcohol dehydrogenases)
VSAAERKAVLFGASGGIGRAISSSLRDSNYQVLEPTRSECDLEKPDTIDSYLSSMPSVPDSVIYAAGINFVQELNSASHENFERTMVVNALSAIKIFAHFAPLQIKNGGGSNLVISSLYSELSRPGRSAYSSSKAALESAIRSFALEFGRSGIRYNIIRPGFIDTPLTRQNNDGPQIANLTEQVPLGRLGLAHEVAGAVKFLISEQASYVTGATLKVDGGFSLA